MVSCARATGISMRIAIFFYFVVGVALIAFGCVLQNPPADYAPGMFVAVGALNLFASLAGFWGSYNKKRVLMVFIIFGSISTLLQIAFAITLHTMFDKVVNAIRDNTEITSDDYKKVPSQLNVMRWVLLGFIFFELLTIVLAVLLKWVVKEEDNRYRGFDDEMNEQRSLNMTNLRSDIERHGPAKSDRAYDNIRNKMALKYGALKGTTSDWKSKMQLSFGPGK